jgi:acetyl-CoA carboxylase beta subunit
VAKEISVDISRVGTEAGESETAASRTRNTCPRCDSHYREEEMVANLRVCAHCGYHFPVTARERIAAGTRSRASCTRRTPSSSSTRDRTPSACRRLSSRPG